ncbi:MAG: flavin monoamine oxidase family protein [Ekhidna sp.]
MSEKRKRVLILGAGLTGLNIARLLQKDGLEVIILEARDRIGGRIFTKESAQNTKVEMGATWLGPQHIHLNSLLQELNIPVFEQFMEGTSYFEPFSTNPPQPVELPPQSPSYRIQGGTASIIEAVMSALHPESIQLNQQVEKVTFDESKVKVFTSEKIEEADVVISTLPPALLARSITFEPELPREITEIALQTQTWMRDSIKAAVVYNSPFWREKNLSGTLFSNVGPLNEFYDHTSYDQDSFAMKGFINSAFSSLSSDEREKLVMDQLQRAFGEDVKASLAYEEVDWSKESYTKGADDSDLFPHQNNGHPIYQYPIYEGRLFIAGSETSPSHGGYMEGAIVSSNNVAESLRRITST